MPESSPQLIDQTIEVWQSRTDRRLSREDARQIVVNATGFFSLLLEWDARERSQALVANSLSAQFPEGGSVDGE